MDKFLNWYNENFTEISWFIVGWLSMSCIEQLSRGNWVAALFDAGLCYFNYYLWKVRQ